MDYKETYLDIKYALINTFLMRHTENILDISYSVNGKVVTIQLVMLDDTALDSFYLDRLNNKMVGYEFAIVKVHVSRENYNSCKGSWKPAAYDWLENVLLSKSEI